MNKLDDILYTYLAPQNRPSPYINGIIYGKLNEKGSTTMKNRFGLKKILIIAVAIVCCALPTYAAIRFLSPAQVATHTQKNAVAQAFESEDAISVNETQAFDNYNVTFLGLVSGETLGDKNILRDGEFELNRTYFVTAVQKSDGSGFESIETAPTFCVSPFVKGYQPTIVNVMTLKGHFEDILVDGIIYRIMDCTNIECFADTTVYLGVTEGMLPQWNAFSYDESTGTVMRNSQFDGMNALFEIPFDSSKADPQRAAEIVNSIIG